MAVVTDPELLKKLNAGDAPTASSTENVVTDPELLNLLNEGSVEEPQPKPQENIVIDNDSPVVADKPLRSLLERSEAVIRGGVPAVAGVFGDLESLGRAMIGNYDDPIFPTTSDVRTYSDPLLDVVFLGEQTRETMSPEDEKALRMTGELLAPTGVATKTASKVAKAVKNKSLTTMEQVKFLKNPEFKYNTEVAPFKLGVGDKVVPDTDAIQLMSNTVPENLASIATKANPETKKVMGKMAKDMIQQSKNPISEVSLNPLSHAGEKVVDRLKFLRGKRKELGGSLKNIVNTELSKVEIPLQDVKDTMVLGVSDAFGLKPVLKKSGGLALPNLDKLDPKTQVAFRKLSVLLDKQSKTGNISGKDAHSLKGILDDLIDSAGGKQGQKQKVENVVKGLRADINNKLREISPVYAKVNNELSLIIEAEAPFKQFSKARNWDAANLDDVVGASLKNIGSDSAKGQQYLNSVLDLDNVALASGAKFKDELPVLFKFNSELRNFLSGIDKSAQSIGGVDYVTRLGDMAASSAVGNTFGAVHDAKNLVGAGMKAKKAEKLVKDRKKALNQMVYILNK
jgi:hypothetical protein